MSLAIQLTADQQAAMESPDCDWLQLNEEQRHVVQSVSTDETCIFYGDALIRLKRAELTRMIEQAVQSATRDALALLGADRFSDIEVDSVPLGCTFMRVTVTDNTGKQASAIGALPDPRLH